MHRAHEVAFKPRCSHTHLAKNTEGWPAIIRAVNTKDAMTATIEEIPYAVLHKIVNRIVTEVEGINRVLYDLTPKPTGTIEWE